MPFRLTEKKSKEGQEQFALHYYAADGALEIERFVATVYRRKDNGEFWLKPRRVANDAYGRHFGPYASPVRAAQVFIKKYGADVEAAESIDLPAKEVAPMVLDPRYFQLVQVSNEDPSLILGTSKTEEPPARESCGCDGGTDDGCYHCTPEKWRHQFCRFPLVRNAAGTKVCPHCKGMKFTAEQWKAISFSGTLP